MVWPSDPELTTVLAHHINAILILPRALFAFMMLSQTEIEGHVTILAHKSTFCTIWDNA